MYIHATTILHNIGIHSLSPLDFLRVLIIAEHLHRDNPSLSMHAIQTKVHEHFLQLYLYRYGIPLADLSKEPSLTAQVMEVRKLIPDVNAFRLFMHDAFPYTIKNDDIIQKLGHNPLSLYTAIYVMLTYSSAYVGAEATNGAKLMDQVYEPNRLIWASLGINTIDAFFKCWQSVYHYECPEQRMFVPSVLTNAMAAYAKHHIPASVLLSHFVQRACCHDSVPKEKKSDELFNPWQSCRKTEGIPQIEHGMTVEEELFKECVTTLINSGIPATDVINGLFYRHRRDILVEKNILFPAVKLDIHYAQRVLVFNPSPDYLVEHSKCALTQNRRTTFVVADDTVAQAYALQYHDKQLVYDFVSMEHFHVAEGTTPPVYDYMIIMGRDAAPDAFARLIPLCRPNARLVCFVPQTMITSQSGINMIELFNHHKICVDSILELPSALSESGKRKKMILRAHVAEALPSHFALITTEYHTPDSPAQNHSENGGKKRSKQKKHSITHYAVPDQMVRRIPYSMLGEHRTIKQMRSYHDLTLQPAHDGDGAKKHYLKGQVFPFSKDINITMNLYEQPDGRYTVRAYRQFESVQYGRQQRGRGKSTAPRKLTRTKYYETGPCSLPEIYARINSWVLRPDIMAQIVQDMEAHYTDCPEKLTLKTVWYCIRTDLTSTYMTYDDKLAVQLFCGERQQISDLPICDIDEEKIFEALERTVPDGQDDQRYRRLLDLIFRMAVHRGFLDAHPFVPTKTSLEYDRKKAMRQLREALKKDSLEFHEMRKVLDFLLEPVDELQTPRAVKESCWLIPLLRLCTAMPLREICALKWKDFHQIEDTDAYQLYITKLVNDLNEPVTITSYRYVRQYRKMPCATLLSTILLQRLQYMEKAYGISPDTAKEQPMILAEEPGAKHAGKKNSTVQCTIAQARKVSSIALEKAEIPSDVITLLEGQAAFLEDLNAYRNDLYYSNFLHHVNNVCGMSEGQVCYLVGRKGPCFAEHYVDWMSDFLQLDMISRIDRLFALVLADNSAAEYTYTICEQTADHAISVHSHSNALASAEVTIIPATPLSAGDIRIRVECQHGAECKITTYTKESYINE